MKQSVLGTYIFVLSLVMLFSACARSGENSPTSNNNAPQQANTNSQPAAAQANAPAASSNTGTPLAVQPIPPPTSLPAPAVQPPTVVPPAVVQATAANNANANIAKPAAAANGPAPKLVAPAKSLEFGKQPENKTLVRAITIKNGGRANLNIESVTPS